ncbi:MAG: AAA family ATPase [Deinococcales bacterium]
MIKQLKLHHWKSFEDATLDIDPLTIMIGTNASGKSNALDALLFLHRVSMGVPIFQAINGDINLPPLRGGAEWVCLKPHQQFSLEVITDGLTEYQDYNYHLNVAVHEKKAEILSEDLTIFDYKKDPNTPTERLLFWAGSEVSNYNTFTHFIWEGQEDWQGIFDNSSTILHRVKFVAEIMKSSQEIGKAAEHVLKSLQKIFVFDPIPSHMRDYSSLADKLLADGSNIAGVLAGLEEKTEIEALLTSYAKELPEHEVKRVWAETVGKFKTDAMLYGEEGGERWMLELCPTAPYAIWPSSQPC